MAAAVAHTARVAHWPTRYQRCRHVREHGGACDRSKRRQGRAQDGRKQSHEVNHVDDYWRTNPAVTMADARGRSAISNNHSSFVKTRVLVPATVMVAGAESLAMPQEK